MQKKDGTIYNENVSINLKDLQIHGLNLMKMFMEEKGTRMNGESFITIYRSILEFQTKIKSTVKDKGKTEKEERRIKRELLPTAEEIKMLYDLDLLNGQNMLGLYNLNNPRLRIIAVEIDTIIELYEGQYADEANKIKSQDMENILNERVIYDYYKKNGITLLLSKLYNRPDDGSDERALSNEFKKRISVNMCEHIIQKGEDVYRKEGIELYEAGIILLEDIEKLIPDFRELIHQRDKESIKNIYGGKEGASFDIRKAKEDGTISDVEAEGLFMDYFEMQLDAENSNKQEILSNILLELRNENITLEVANVFMLELQKELMIAVDRGEIDKGSFYSLQGLSEITKNDLINLYGDKEDAQKPKTITILMYFNMNLLSYEDFQWLYHEGIVGEEDWFNETKENLFNWMDKLGHTREKIIDLYIDCMLSEQKLQELLRLGLINQEFYDRAIEGLKIGDIMTELGISPDKLLSEPDDSYYKGYDLDDMPDIMLPENKFGGNTGRETYGGNPKIEYREIINPDAREELFMCGYKAKKIPRDKLIIPSKSAFEDYEFYIIPEQDGSINPDSIVIAERFYKDRGSEEKFAYGNATYLFKIKDLVRIFKKSNKEIKDIEGGKDTVGVKRVVHQGRYWQEKNKKMARGSYARMFRNRLSEIKEINLESIYMPSEMRLINELSENIDTIEGWHQIPIIVGEYYDR